MDSGAASVVRGGKALLRKRNDLDTVGLTEDQWRREWESARLFLTADGEKDAPWGNYTIRWNPDAGWLEINLPPSLAHLANQSRGRYRLSATVGFSYRGDEAAAQAASGAVRYDIRHDPVTRTLVHRRLLDERSPHPRRPLMNCGSTLSLRSTSTPGTSLPPHIAADGNILGVPSTVSLALRRPASRHEGRAAPGSHQRPHRHREKPRGAERSSSRTSISPKPAPRDANRPATDPHGAGVAGDSDARSLASRPRASVTGSPRWHPMRVCPW